MNLMSLEFNVTSERFGSRSNKEGVYLDPGSLVIGRAQAGFSPIVQANDNNRKHNTLMSANAVSYPASNTLSDSFSPFYDDLDIDLHKLKNSKPLEDFISKQKYEGIVLNVLDSSFVARLQNLSENIADEVAEFAIEELNSDDIPLLKEGAIFYWHIGFLIVFGGYKYPCHMLNFRRLPVWTKNEIEEADKRAEALLYKLSINDE